MFEYYYNNVPGIGKCRNNLVYTSKIDRQNQLFSIQYTHDQTYHNNQCLPTDYLEQKWIREVKFLVDFAAQFPDHVPEIVNIDYKTKEIILSIQGDDFWQQANCDSRNYIKVVNNWEEQILQILKDYRSANIWKYSLHPSSFFVVDGKLKSINHFFCYYSNEPKIAITEILDHVSDNRKQKLFDYLEKNKIDPNKKLPFEAYGQICLDSFRSEYSDNFIERAKQVYV